jgi:hypothetical protein
MTRSSARRLWLIIVLGLLAAAYFVYQKGQDLQTQIASTESRRIQLTNDLRKGNQFSAALTDLDNFTINEQNATTLDILRHLDLEESNMNYETRSRTVRPVAGVNLYTRRFALSGVMPYGEALNQTDWLHNTNKVVIDRVEIRPGEGYGDVVQLQIEGTLYGLDK